MHKISCWSLLSSCYYRTTVLIINENFFPSLFSTHPSSSSRNDFKKLKLLFFIRGKIACINTVCRWGGFYSLANVSWVHFFSIFNYKSGFFVYTFFFKVQHCRRSHLRLVETVFFSFFATCTTFFCSLSLSPHLLL